MVEITDPEDESLVQGTVHVDLHTESIPQPSLARQARLFLDSYGTYAAGVTQVWGTPPHDWEDVIDWDTTKIPGTENPFKDGQHTVKAQLGEANQGQFPPVPPNPTPITVETERFQTTITDCPSGWLPEGGPSQGNTVQFTASITPAASTTIKFTLSYVSTEPGYCMNAGTQSTEAYDLKFTEADNPGFSIGDGGLTASKSNVSSATVTVRCYDYGAWGYIKAEAALDDEPSPSKNIPVDGNVNHIADSWSGNTGAAADDNETDPAGDGTPGDGFSRYEEYRGFMCNGTWTDLDPTKKDIFVCDVNGIGNGYYSASGLAIRNLKSDGSEYDGNRVVNFKRETPGGSNQKGLRLIQDTTLYVGKRGESDTETGFPTTPNEANWHKVYTADIGRVYVDAKEGAVIDMVIAHELAHGCHVNHHESGPSYPVGCIMQTGAAPPSDPLQIPNTYCEAQHAQDEEYGGGTDPGCTYQFKLH